MDTIPQPIPQGKHYIYIHAYPESMGGYFFYVGKGTGNRIDHHEWEAKIGKSNNPYKINVINKIWNAGEQVTKEKIAYFDTHEEALMYEVALIFFMRPYEHLTNITDGGEGVQMKRSEKTCRKLSEIGKKRGFPKAALLRAIEVNTGCERSEETRRRQSEAKLGKHASEDARLNLSKARMGLKLGPFSEQHRQRIGQAQEGRPKSAEACRNMSRSQKRRQEARRALVAQQKTIHQLYLFE